MTTVQGEFERWRDKVFARPLPEDQARCVEMAFYAGVSSTSHVLQVEGGLARETAAPKLAAAIDSIVNDVRQHCRRFMS
jgi:hypothetical protein